MFMCISLSVYLYARWLKLLDVTLCLILSIEQPKLKKKKQK